MNRGPSDGEDAAPPSRPVRSAPSFGQSNHCRGLRLSARRPASASTSLHNGSVPTLWHLLRPDQRPEGFYRGYDVYNPDRVGLEWRVLEEEGRRFFLYDTRQPGNSNQGQMYGSQLNEAQKVALVEYLKTL